MIEKAEEQFMVKQIKDDLFEVTRGNNIKFSIKCDMVYYGEQGKIYYEKPESEESVSFLSLSVKNDKCEVRFDKTCYHYVIKIYNNQIQCDIEIENEGKSQYDYTFYKLFNDITITQLHMDNLKKTMEQNDMSFMDRIFFNMIGSVENINKNPDNTSNPDKTNNQNAWKIACIIFIILFVIALGLNGYLYFNSVPGSIEVNTEIPLNEVL